MVGLPSSPGSGLGILKETVPETKRSCRLSLSQPQVPALRGSDSEKLKPHGSFKYAASHVAIHANGVSQGLKPQLAPTANPIWAGAFLF